MKEILRVTILLFATCAVASATTYYVSTSGNDGNPGTNAQPWETISHAAGVAVAGDTVIVENGTYVESPALKHSGTAGSPITFQSQNKYGAIIAPTSSGIAVPISGSYVTVKNFEITDGAANTLIKIGNTYTNAQILGNKLHHWGVTSGQCIGGASVVSGAANTVIDSNLIYDFGPALSGGVCTSYDGIYLNDGNNQTVTNNIVLLSNNDGAMLQMNGEEAATANFPSNENMSNNTVVNGAMGGDGLYETCWPSGAVCDNNTFNNNIFYSVNNDSNSGAIFYQHQAGGTFGSHNQYSNNLVFASGSYYNMISGQTITNAVTSNPLFVNNTGDQTGDYHLQGTSPAIAAGTSTGCPNHDFDGNSHPQGSACDIGAYEDLPSASAPSAPTGLTATVQ